MSSDSSENDKLLYTFGIVTDIQGADKDTHKFRYYRDANGKFAKCVDSWNARDDLTFCIQLGDIIDGGITHEHSFKEMTEVVALVRKCKHPFYHVIGNHCLKYPGGKLRVQECLGMKDQAAFYRFVPESSAVQQANHRFIVLDGTDISVNQWDPEDPKSKQAQKWLDDHPIEDFPNAVNWNGAISKDQLSWLETELQAARQSDSKVFIFCHYPILADHLEMAVHLLWNSNEVVDLLDKFTDVVIAYFCGHYHPGGAELPSKHTWGHVVLEAILTSPVQSYGYVEVYPHRIELKGVGSCTSHTWKY